ncbi:MAG: rod shape-determining protein MreD [Dysgonamonadaceae bacterium]|jgi:rod shape-determining protein MreD|nr:rod shape-determining protein MreD [Dysgonamonadaceae bacterium]
MSRTNVTGLVFLFIVLVVLQIGLFDKIHLFGYATPLLSIYFIIKLPAQINKSWLQIWSASIGMAIDLFTGTLGLNLLACVVSAFLRPAILKLFEPRDQVEDYMPSFTSLGGQWMFIRYAVAMTLLHHFCIFTVETFSLFNLWSLLLHIIASSILTVLLIIACESMRIDWLQ